MHEAGPAAGQPEDQVAVGVLAIGRDAIALGEIHRDEARRDTVDRRIEVLVGPCPIAEAESRSRPVTPGGAPERVGDRVPARAAAENGLAALRILHG